MTDEPCLDCDNNTDGTCHWQGCPFPADYTIRDVTVKRQGIHIRVGDIDLCGGHMRRTERLGRLELDWERIADAAVTMTDR